MKDREDVFDSFFSFVVFSIAASLCYYIGRCDASDKIYKQAVSKGYATYSADGSFKWEGKNADSEGQE